MNIEKINNVVFEYIVKMIKDDEDINIYNIIEEQYEEDIINELFNNWNESDGFDIITEYFGNTLIFNPTFTSVIKMSNLIRNESLDKCGIENETTYEHCIGLNIHHTHCNVLRHYSYWYVLSLGYKDFKLKLKNYIKNE